MLIIFGIRIWKFNNIIFKFSYINIWIDNIRMDSNGLYRNCPTSEASFLWLLPLPCRSLTLFCGLNFEVVVFSTRIPEGDEIIVCFFQRRNLSEDQIINLAASSSASKSWEMNIQGRHTVMRWRRSNTLVTLTSPDKKISACRCSV